MNAKTAFRFLLSRKESQVSADSSKWGYEVEDLLFVSDQPYKRIRLVKPSGTGKAVIRDAWLINPILGSRSANFRGDIDEGQLKSLATTWREICGRGTKTFGNANDVSSLLVEGEYRALVISTKGEVFEVSQHSR